MDRILVVEDEQAVASAVGAVCRMVGREPILCASGAAALREFDAAGGVGLAVLDIGLPDMDGIELFRQLRARTPELPVVVISAHGTLDAALAAKRMGVVAFLLKPFDARDLENTLRDALSTPADEVPATGPLPMLLGGSPAMQRVFLEIAHACVSDAPVLLVGPTGSGKNLAAQAIHLHGARRAGPFVALHCAALPEALLESELFGHERGAFTGALASVSGHIERAEGGTLFLDEIGDLPPAVQVKLLRFVEEKTFTRLGGREERIVDVRLLSATHRDLKEEVREGRFREDLYYRLRVLEIGLPALRDRASDIPMLARMFLDRAAAGRGLQFAPEVLELLRRHDWPGNVRELRNVVERAVAVAGGGVILARHLPEEFSVRPAGSPDGHFAEALGEWLDRRVSEGADWDAIHDAVEEMALAHLIERFGNKPTALARELRMNRVTLRRKLGRLNPKEEDGGARCDGLG